MGLILLVDDDPHIVSMLSSILELSGHKVNACTSPENALKNATKNKYDLIICDILMPKMDGYQFYNKLRELKIFTPFAFMSGCELNEKTNELVKSGQALFLQKPFEIIGTIEMIDKIIKREAQKSPSSNAA